MKVKPTYEELKNRVKELESSQYKSNIIDFEGINDFEKQNRLWIQNSPVCTKIVDLDFNLQFMSEAGVKGLQIENIDQYYGQQYPLNFFPDSFKIPMAKNLKKVKDSGVITRDAEILDLNGQKIWFHSTIVPVYDENGEPDYYLVISVDITEQKQIEDKLKKSEERLSRVMDNSGDWVWEVDTNGLYTYVSDAVEDALGYKASEIINKKHFYDFFHESNYENLKRHNFERMKQEKSFRDAENLMVAKNGDLVWISTSGAPAYNQKGDLIGYLGADSNVTKRKNSQIEYLRSKNLLSKTSQLGKIGGWEVDLKTMESYFTEETFNIHEISNKYTPSIEEGMNYYTPEAQPIIRKAFNDAINKGKPYDVKLPFTTAKGKNIWVRTVGEPILKKGKTVFLVGNIQDITEIKKGELELIRIKEKAVESDRLKSAFLANMSHEIRTPMNGILGFATLLKKPNVSVENQKEYLTIIEKSGERMLGIINDIVNISKIESGMMDLNMNESNINEQIEYIYTFFKPEVESKGMQISFKNSLTAIDSTITTDREKVFAVLTNLVKNAIKYSDKGSIELGYNKKGDYLEFYVKDTGVGISQDRLDAIFERFIQADINDTHASDGAGLGLSISKAYIEMLSGKIWAESEVNKGSTFYFTLPYNKSTTKASFSSKENSNEIELPKLKKIKILIVEDDEISQMLISSIVEDFSSKTIHAVTGKEAVKTAQENPDIDLILMDIQLPEMNGYNATKQIRKTNKDVIIIAQTAFGLDGDRDKAINAGCNDYIAKPIKKDKLIEIISKYF